MGRQMTTSQVARRLGVSSERVRQLMREGRLVHVVTPLGRLVDEEVLEAFAGGWKRRKWKKQ